MPMMDGMQILCGVEVSTEMELSELTRPPTNLKMHQTTFFDDNGDNDDDIDHDYDVLDGDHCYHRAHFDDHGDNGNDDIVKTPTGIKIYEHIVSNQYCQRFILLPLNHIFWQQMV